MWGRKRFVVLMVVVAIALIGLGYQRSKVEQRGYRGTAMVQLERPSITEAKDKINVYPPPLRPARMDGPLASEAYENIQVLGDLHKAQLPRLMLSIKTWVVPEEGCGYCHNAPNYAADDKYPKLVAREMLKMVRRINTEWTQHVGKTGVTCFTCHRGHPVPGRIWFSSPGRHPNGAMVPSRADYRQPTPSAWATTLPEDPLTDYLLHDRNVRVAGTTPLPTGNPHTVLDAKSTYSLMLVMSDSLGVNCTFCHNTRSFAAWDQSTPQRVTAWYGIRMVRDLNNTTMAKVSTLLPQNRMGPAGDGPKIYCATCHRGSQKPLNGAHLLDAYPELRPVRADAGDAAASPPTAPSTP
jgi:photosynthetic reaction center cytochrome c subunit